MQKNDKTLNVSLTYPQFFELLLYCSDHSEEPELYQLGKILNDKLDRMVIRELYTKSKTAPTDEEKEQARREYLDRKGIPDSFRW